MKRILIPRHVHLLAEFANLKPEGAAGFQKLSQEEGFAPDAWWTGVAFGPSPVPIWQREQEQLRRAWDSHFASPPWLDLIISSTKYSAAEELMKRYSAKTLQIRDEDGFKFVSKRMSNLPPAHVYSYYEAIVFVAQTHPWCAKICKWPECQKYFVADMNRTEHCSLECINHKKQLNKRNSWDKPGGGNDQRKARRKAETT